MPALIHPHERKALAAQIKADIDAFCQLAYDDGHRNHLGASMMGEECARKLWYVFRWVKHTQHPGRLYRLFNRGHREEARYLEWLKGIGFKFWELGLDDKGKEKQHRISGVGGHYGGSLDSIGLLPERYATLFKFVPDLGPCLIEFKTNGTGAGFEKLNSHGVEVAKPMHWSQMCQYGAKYGYKYAIYFNINKNDDDLYVEVVELNFSVGNDLERKAEAVISAAMPPVRINESPAFWQCKNCDFLAVCHKGERYEKNCRSCKFAVPVADGKWSCQKWNLPEIPPEGIVQGCPQWSEVGRS